MYEELVKRLRGHANLVREYNERGKLFDDAADAIEELSKENESLGESLCESAELVRKLRKPKWIPVTERLPEAGKRVLCYCRANIYEVMKMRTDGDWEYDTNHVYMHSFVTHWMPLPEPPIKNKMIDGQNKDYIKMIDRNNKKKREYYRKCGICGGRFNQKDMIRDYGSSSGWICDDCFRSLHIEYDIEDW